jgi:hypothetical protein
VFLDETLLRLARGLLRLVTGLGMFPWSAPVGPSADHRKPLLRILVHRPSGSAADDVAGIVRFGAHGENLAC